MASKELKTTLPRVWVAVIAVPLLFQAAVFYYLCNYGLLRGLIGRDDAYIILRALRQLNSLSNAESFASLIERIARVYIHSPLSDMQAMVGLLISGGNILAPFTMSFWCLSLVLYVIVTRAHKMNNVLLGAILVFILNSAAHDYLFDVPEGRLQRWIIDRDCDILFV